MSRDRSRKIESESTHTCMYVSECVYRFTWGERYSGYVCLLFSFSVSFFPETWRREAINFVVLCARDRVIKGLISLAQKLRVNARRHGRRARRKFMYLYSRMCVRRRAVFFFWRKRGKRERTRIKFCANMAGFWEKYLWGGFYFSELERATGFGDLIYGER